MDVEHEARIFASNLEKIRREIAKSIVGQNAILEGVLAALFTGGHVLLEGLPGLGKTRLVKALASALELDFARVQCTPDLMPADIIGTQILGMPQAGLANGRAFEFQRGPVFCNLLLVDEINRATPKTQSALLQAMQESAVTVGNATYELPQPHIVLATQNPIELEGTYPLPEAQLDRFMLKLLVQPAELAELVAILELTTAGAAVKTQKVLERSAILSSRELIAAVPAAPNVVEFAARLALATDPRSKDAPASVRANVRYGSSPRGAQALLLAAKYFALAAGRFNAALDDVKKAALPALRHRIILNFEGDAAGISTDRMVEEIVAHVGGARA